MEQTQTVARIIANIAYYRRKNNTTMIEIMERLLATTCSQFNGEAIR